MTLIHRKRSQHGRPTGSRPSRRTTRFHPTHVEGLEDRSLLSSIVWSNQGSSTSDTDGFNRVFGANAATARSVVVYALIDWHTLFTNFNHSDGSDTISVAISMGTSTGFGAAATSGGSWQIDGKPTQAAITINTGSNAFGSGWYLDPSPWDSEEFRGTIVNAYAANATPGGPADGLADLYTVVVQEMAHALGLNDSPNELFTQDPNGYLTNTGQADSAVVGTLWTYNGPDVQALFTTDNGGSESRAHPLHTAEPDAGNLITSGGITYYGAQDAGNAIFETFPSRRYLPSNLDRLVLADSYNYSTIAPYNNMYATLDTTTGNTTGNLLIRGGSAGEHIYNGQSDSSDDTITLSTYTRTFSGITSRYYLVAETIGNPVPGTGPNVTLYSSFYAGSVSTITIEPGDGSNRVNIEGTWPNTTTTVIGRGSDTVVVGKLGSVQGILGPVEVLGTSSGFSYLTVDDSSDPTARIATLVDGSITGLAPAAISWTPSDKFYGGVTWLNVYGGSGDDTFNVQNTSNLSWWTYLSAGGGSNSVNVYATTGPLNVDGGAGFEWVNVGMGTTADIRGWVAVYNSSPSGYSFLDVDDRSDPTGRTANIDDGTITGLAPATISWTPSATFSGGVTNVVVYGGSGSDTMNVNGTGALYAFMYLYTGDGNDKINVRATTCGLNVSSSGGSDTAVVGSLAPTTNGGTLAAITGKVQFFGLFPISLTVDDSGDSAQHTVTIAATSITGLAPATIYDSFRVTSRTIKGGSGSNTYTISDSPASTTTLYSGAGNDTIHVGTGDLDALVGGLTVDGQNGTDSIVVDDSANAAAAGYSITTTKVTRAGFGGLTIGTTESLTVRGAAAKSTFNVKSTLASMPLSVDGGAGSDTFNVGNPRLDTIKGAVTINGGGGTLDLVDMIDTGQTTGSTYTLTNTSFIRTGSTAIGAITYSNVEELEVKAGSGNDSIKANTLTLRTILLGNRGNDSINGGSGNDSIDGGLGNDSLVGNNGNDAIKGSGGHDRIDGGNGNDLITISGAGNSTVFGGAGNDKLTDAGSGHSILVGGDDNDTLLCTGTNKDLLIGGAGKDTMTGNGNDLLVTDPTRYDSNRTALDAILAEWTSADSYSLRISRIRNGGGLNGSYKLNPSTVLNDGYGNIAKDASGNNGDWFVTNTADSVTLQAGETRTNLH